MIVGVVTSYKDSVLAQQFSATEVVVYQGVRDHLDALKGLAALVIESDDSQWLEAECGLLRASVEHYLLPIFYCSLTALDRDKCLFDGGFESELALLATVRSIPSDTALADIGISQEERLLRYLWTRPHYNLEPRKNWRIEGLYDYPLASLFVDQSTDAGLLIHSLVNRGLLREDNLVDRVPHCPSCSSAHLVFVETCTNCYSIDIKNTPFIHCFSCGNVEPQDKFMNGGSLNCARCHTQLRHIGVDYDRPMENYQCHACRHHFEAPEVKSNCAGCNTLSNPEDLIKREVYTLCLTEKGKMAAEHGESNDVGRVLDSINFANVTVFNFLLTWSLGVYVRHQSPIFSLVLLKLKNVSELIEHLGHNRINILMQGFAERVGELVRTTDLCTRSSEELFWVFLPHTPEEGCNVFTSRLHDIVEQTRQDDGSILELGVVSYTCDETNSKNLDADLLMAKLCSDVDAAVVGE